MPDTTEDPAALERLRVQRGRLADRMRAPWWYLPGSAIGWALAFTAPFGSRFLPKGFSTWPILLAVVVVFYLLQWGLTRATGIALAARTMRYPTGRPAGVVIIVVLVVVTIVETLLIQHSLYVAAVILAVIAVLIEVVGQQANLRGIREDLRAGEGVV